MQDLPGEELFRYVDGDGETRRIESSDVNAYLKEISGDDFTSKDFRTWSGTLLAARALLALAPPASQAEGRRSIAQAIEAVAKQLGNTKAVCRKCYVHPAVLASYLEGRLAQTLRGGAAEKTIVALLEARMRRERASAQRSLGRLLARSLRSARRSHRNTGQHLMRGAA
jgi:DNA topoisomerase-1